MSNGCPCRKQRQWRNVALIILEAFVQWLNLILYVVPNAILATQPCYISTSMMYWFGFARWSCWNIVSCNNCMQCLEGLYGHGALQLLNKVLTVVDTML